MDPGGSAAGQTPVDTDDAEASNIADALLWLVDQEPTPDHVLQHSFLRELHRQMFGEVWS